MLWNGEQSMQSVVNWFEASWLFWGFFYIVASNALQHDVLHALHALHLNVDICRTLTENDKKILLWAIKPHTLLHNALMSWVICKLFVADNFNVFSELSVKYLVFFFSSHPPCRLLSWELPRLWCFPAPQDDADIPIHPQEIWHSLWQGKWQLVSVAWH